MRYLGTESIIVHGTSGNAYRFSAMRPEVNVFEQDAAGLVASGLFELII